MPLPNENSLAPEARAGARPWMAYGLTAVVLAVTVIVLPRFVPLDWRQVLSALKQFAWPTLVAVFWLNVLQHFLHVSRVYLLGASLDRRFSRFLYAITLGQAANIALPGRAGDLFKAVLLGRSSRDAEDTVFSSGGLLVVDKAVDASAFLLIAVIFGVHRQPAVAAAIRWGLVGALVVAVGWLAVGRWLGRQAWPKWLRELGSGFARALRNPRVTLAILVGMGVWFCEISMISLLAQGVGAPIELEQAAFALTILVLGTAVPISVGNLGTFEVALMLGLQQCGVSAHQAIAVAVAHHGLQSFSTLIWCGIAFGWRPGTLKTSLVSPTT